MAAYIRVFLTIVADPALIHWKCQCKYYIPIAQREICKETNIWYTDYNAGNLHVFDVPIKVFRSMQSKTLSFKSQCSTTLCDWSSTNSCWQSSVFPSRPLPLSLQRLSDFFVTLKQRAHEQHYAAWYSRQGRPDRPRRQYSMEILQGMKQRHLQQRAYSEWMERERLIGDEKEIYS